MNFDSALKRCPNVEYMGPFTIEDLGTYPLYSLTEISAEEWNRRALETNRRSFQDANGRPPVSDDELWEWVYVSPREDKREGLEALARFYEAHGWKEKAEQARKKAM